MMGWIAKIGLEIFGGKASMIFGVIMLISLSTMAYNWKQSYDGKITARANAVHTQAELERAEQARDIYAEETSRRMDNEVKDQQAIVQLQRFSKSREALINEALKELGKLDGGDAIIATNRQRVLAIRLKKLRAAASGLPYDSEGISP